MTVMDTLQFDLADRIRKAREARGWDIGQMAEAIGVSRSSISNWEHRKHAPHHKNLADIAQATGVPLSWLLEADQEVLPPASNSLGLHRGQHDAAVEAAVLYSQANGGERVVLTDSEGMTIIEGGRVTATVARGAPIAQLAELRTFNPKSALGAADSDALRVLHLLGVGRMAKLLQRPGLRIR